MSTPPVARGSRPVRIANCSGFFGDRLSAAREQVDGGPIDVLSGDWLAELTMLILARQRLKDPSSGWARTFGTQMEQVLGTCAERGIRVVTNAGGLNPAGCANAIRELAARLGVDIVVAHLEGDDLIDRRDVLGDAVNLDTGEPLAVLGADPVCANAYLGGRGIAHALSNGADVVICGRVTDAALAVGAAAWWWDWAWDDFDALGGAVVAGHVIECGPQATGGNYAFFGEIPDLTRPGFPIAEIDRDGSAVITKHPGTGGRVSTGTVTAQLLYEIGEARYPNPDVTARFDTIRVDDLGDDRVQISQTRGEAPPPTAKVAINTLAGFRNHMTFVLTGLDIAAKADAVLAALWANVPGGADAFDAVDVRLDRTDRPDPATNAEAVAWLHVDVTSRDAGLVGRRFSSAAVELALASYPGFFATSPPGDASPYGVYWPCTVPTTALTPEIVWADGRRDPIPPPPATLALTPEAAEPLAHTAPTARPDSPDSPDSDAPEPATTPVPFGRIAGARSGDKGGNANIGVWVRSDAAYDWLVRYLTPDRIRTLLPECAPLAIDVHPLPNLRAVNVVVHGLLGRGVAASTRLDAQAKGLGEWLRARVVPVPTALLTGIPAERNADTEATR